MRKLYFLGRQGKIESFGTIDQLRAEDERRVQQGLHPLLTPIAESRLTDFHAVRNSLKYPIKGDCDMAIRKWVEIWYESFPRFDGTYGDYGDVITVLHSENECIITDIAARAHIKPAIATDLVPIVIDGDNNCFLIAIERGTPPAVGKLAFIGGHNDVRGAHLNSAIETFTTEAWEEAGLPLMRQDEHSQRHSPFPESCPVGVKLLDNWLHATAHLVGIFYTGEEEITRPDHRRVHATAGYLLPIRIPRVTSAEALAAVLIPRDKHENTKIAVRQVGRDEIRFGMSHHATLWDAALDRLIEIGLADRSRKGEK